ncbi:helix-turn-helix transcriptional regulator [Butyrivibrio sp. MC2013]|uniref:helix-turn-helix transcriptional regulator n=1 Tax=Butyrivibrio sp. MC2013 TaxID=1280686 RepID=UPI000419DD95|nr:helix-turn-helix transcriptional regulator [Butyrivibrio sp. MC2013]
MEALNELNSIFRLHRLFETGMGFSDILDSKRFLSNVKAAGTELLLHPHFGGAISYGIPTTFEYAGSPYYLLLYMEKGDASVKGKELDAFKISEKEMIIAGPGIDFRFDTRSTPCFFHLFLITGSAMTLYCDGISRISFKENYIAGQLSYLQKLLSQQGEDIEYLESRLLTEVLTDAYLECNKHKETGSYSPIPDYIREMKRILDMEYKSQLTLDELAGRLYISKYRLCREFGSYYSISPLQYLNHLRIQKAKALLEQTDISVHAIGMDVGIPNTSHFIKLFKRDTGRTPAEYRKRG